MYVREKIWKPMHKAIKKHNFKTNIELESWCVEYFGEFDREMSREVVGLCMDGVLEFVCDSTSNLCNK